MPLDPLLMSTAVEAVLAAGDIQMTYFGKSIRVDKKSEIDLVTHVDLEVERRFRDMIASRFPSHCVLGEELGGDTGAEAGNADYCWVFDPVDGTTNYAHGMPIFCSSLALRINGRTELGAIYDPTRRELFTAERGQGARLNGAPMRVSATTGLIDAILVTGFPYDVHQTIEEVVGLFSMFVGRARAVRRLGSAALDLTYVAAGRLDGFWEQRLKPWDIAAGVLILQEAGGTATRFDGAAIDLAADEVVASNGTLQEQMVRTIRDFRESRLSRT